MEFIKKILDIKLVNNDILIINNILSYIKDHSICEECKKFNKCKLSYQKIKIGRSRDSCRDFYDNKLKERKLCHYCFVDIMKNHDFGKNGILNEREFFYYCKHNYIE
jgi:hypothetical protein